MGAQIPAGYGQANLIYQAVGAIRPSEVTLGFKDHVTSTATEKANAIYDDFTATGSPGAAASMNTSWQFLGVRVTYMLESGPIVGEWFSTKTGTVVQAPVPSNCALLIRKNTGAGGRRNRGRMFVPPTAVPEANVDQNGVLTAGTVTSAQTQWNAFITLLAANPMEPYLFHSSGGATPELITSLSVQSVLATQRRRMR